MLTHPGACSKYIGGTSMDLNISRLEKILEDELTRARKSNLVADLTMGQWIQTLKHFDYSCAYCGGRYEVLEHYLPIVRGGGTTQSNCVPACQRCNIQKDAGSRQRVFIYNKPSVINFLKIMGVSVNIHSHIYSYSKSDIYGRMWNMTCACGDAFMFDGNESNAINYIEANNGQHGLISVKNMVRPI
jgi:HNH endonuclease